MRKLLLLIAGFVFLMPHAEKNVFAGAITPEFLEKKSEEAREILKEEKVAYYRKGKTITAREILLAVYSQERDEIDLVRLKVRVYPEQKKKTKIIKTKKGRRKIVKTMRATPQPFSFSVLTPGYSVERIGQGIGPIRLNFSVSDKRGEELILLDSKTFVKFLMRGVLYFPYTDSYLSNYAVKEGGRFFRTKIRSAKKELCELGVRSRAYQDKLLCEVFEDAFPANLGYIEQTDDKEFTDECPDPESLEPENRIYSDCAKYTFDKFLIRFWRNKDTAYALASSNASASGLMQFMNTKRVPTYSMMVKAYPEAKLMPDYKTGAADIVNSIKAALCLLDHDLSSFPQSVRDEFLQNPRMAGLILAASYNGGFGSAAKLYSALTRKKIDWGSATQIPSETIQQETVGYITKYLAAWGMIDELFAELDKEELETKGQSH